MYQRILLPLDGSALSEQALPHAAAQAEYFQAELILLRVLPPLPTSRGQESSASKWAEDYTADLARQYLENIAATLSAQPKLHKRRMSDATLQKHSCCH